MLVELKILAQEFLFRFAYPFLLMETKLLNTFSVGLTIAGAAICNVTFFL